MLVGAFKLESLEISLRKIVSHFNLLKAAGLQGDGCLRASPEAGILCCKSIGRSEMFKGRRFSSGHRAVSGLPALWGGVKQGKQSSSSKSVPNFGLLTLLCYSNGVISPSDSGAAAGQGVHQSGIWCHLSVTSL